MRTLIIIAALLIPASLISQGTAALAGRAYYLSTSGNDSNAGTIAFPWSSPHHAVNCGDVLYASSGTYSSSNFSSGRWGVVSCAQGNRVAWLACATFDGCKINANNDYGMYVDQSYWGVQGWEVSTTANAGCSSNPSLCGFTAFATAPNIGTPLNIHHIVFANDIANGAGGGGFSGFNVGTHSVDYVAFIGDIAYNATQNNLHCYSGMTIFQPLASDSIAGTHLYVGGNFAWHNFDPNPCDGTAPTAGVLFISDTFDGAQGLGTQYGQQLVVQNNIGIGNGASCIEHQIYTKNSAIIPTVYWRNNTCWGNLLDVNVNTNLCVEMLVDLGYGINSDHNISQTTATAACTSHSTYAAYAYDTSSLTSTIATNWFFSAAGSGFACDHFNDDGNTFTCGTNSAGSPPVSPAFAAPSVPGAPSCGGKSSVPNCMAATIANFAPTAGGTAGFGYQTVSNTPVSDALFPAWLCYINLPPSLITRGCVGH